jgi:hypothetical protein
VNRTRDLPACSTVPELTTLPRAAPSSESGDFVVCFSHGVRLGALDTEATVWPFVPAPDDR